MGMRLIIFKVTGHQKIKAKVEVHLLFGWNLYTGEYGICGGAQCRPLDLPH